MFKASSDYVARLSVDHSKVKPKEKGSLGPRKRTPQGPDSIADIVPFIFSVKIRLGTIRQLRTKAGTVAAKPINHAHNQMDVCGDAQLTATQCGRTTSSTSPRNNTFMNTRDAGTFSTTIRFPPLFSSDLGPPVLLYPSPTLTARMHYGEDLSLSYPHSYDSYDPINILKITMRSSTEVEIPLDELLRGMDELLGEMDGFDGMGGMEGLDGGDDMDGLLNHLHLLFNQFTQTTTTASSSTPPLFGTTSLVPPSKNPNANDFDGEDESQDVEMFDHSSSAYHPLIFDDNPNNEHISSFDCDLNSAEPIQVPIPTVSGDSLRVLFGDSPSGRLSTPFEEALSFSGQQGRLSRLSSPTSRSSHHTHLSNHKDDAEFSVDVDVESDNSDSKSNSSESVELMMSSPTTMTLSSAQHSTEFVYSGAGSSKSLSQRRSTTTRPSSPTGGGGVAGGGLSVSSKPRASSRPHNRPTPWANARAMPRPSARQTARAGACAYGVNVFEWSVDEIRFAECDCTSEFACSVDLKDLVARMEKLERETHELEAKNRDLENRVDRMAHVGRQEEEAQVERMSERAREVTGYGAHQKRMGEEETVYDSRSGKVPRGNYAESVHDMGGRGNGHRDFRQNESHTRGSYQHNRAYGMPPPRLGQPAPTAPAKDKQDLRLAIGVFRGQYATATVGEQIALIAQTVPRSFIPSDARRDDYRFGLLVMTFRSYNDRDAFTQEWSAHYKNSLLEWEGLKLRGIGEDF
ncbi:uncharacterized protein C8R40DRAFT_1167698 [Lentinula edodes]|uniref:uncharacterized protein n=1 Tax=Lentinula edodes TaxID=5353 RepID=UPI001E8CBEB6|nr:uncharacterized protein C8R40DRAFT_1167698 [Lentinula edodes]KAH7878277.1 hypothetical protein C8R40DRAFT_1167698 [Lentinula edodes]